MRKALVTQDGTIVEVRDDTFEVHPDLSWIDVPDDTEAYRDKWEFTRNERIPPAPIPIPAPVRQRRDPAERLERILIRRGVITRKDIDDEDATA